MIRGITKNLFIKGNIMKLPTHPQTQLKYVCVYFFLYNKKKNISNINEH